MKKVFVSGLVTAETNLQISKFPLDYAPMCFPFFGIDSDISGVGYNVAAALATLGNKVWLATIMGKDFFADLATAKMQERGITPLVDSCAQATSQSVILVEEGGRRMGNCDLKDIQDCKLTIDFKSMVDEADLIVPCNINFSRDVLAYAKQTSKLIAVDVHTLSQVFDDYNADFLRNAHILFLSNEYIMGQEQQFVSQLFERYANKIIVVGMGANGALLHTHDNGFAFVPAKKVAVKNTVGAGDALFSAFVHSYLHTNNALLSLEQATVFASEKIKHSGGANGFLTHEQLQKKYNELS